MEGEVIHDVKVYNGKGKLIRTHTTPELTKRFWENVSSDLSGNANKARRSARQKVAMQAAFYARSKLNLKPGGRKS